MTGKSFRGCLNYCLHDKLAGEKKNEAVTKDRAEVISYNLCFGNAKELTQQFNEVRQLNLKQSKPVMHITLSLAKGEQLRQDQLAAIAEHCAKDLGFQNNQYVVIEHKDTAHRHLHIVINIIGFDGKTISDSNNYQKIAQFCRKIETEYQLKQVQNPNRFLAKEERNYDRWDKRKQQLKTDIEQSLIKAKDYEQFERNMKSLKYEVIRMRGIAFRDEKKVYTKGSEVGYSLGKIEKILQHKSSIDIKSELPHLQKRNSSETNEELIGFFSKSQQLSIENNALLAALLATENSTNESVNQALLKEQRKRRKKLKQQRL